jgi:hypothetical protein
MRYDYDDSFLAPETTVSLHFDAGWHDDAEDPQIEHDDLLGHSDRRERPDADECERRGLLRRLLG